MKLENGIDMSQSVRALGLPAANTAIADFGERRVLVVERFDRVWTKDDRLLRIPQETSARRYPSRPSRKRLSL